MTRKRSIVAGVAALLALLAALALLSDGGLGWAGKQSGIAIKLSLKPFQVIACKRDASSLSCRRFPGPD